MTENQELIHLNPPVRIHGTIGLIQGDLWIREGSIRSNILLDLEFDKPRYERLCKLLNLEAIFLKFAELDLSTSISSLTFSEKFMINLARAMYRKTSIFLIEDVIWRLDDYWQKLVIKSVICDENTSTGTGPNRDRVNCIEEFSNKTWIVITHNLDLLQRADNIVFLENKEIKEIGKLQQLKGSPCFEDIKQGIERENKQFNVSMMSESEISLSRATNITQMLQEDLKTEHPLENSEALEHVPGWRYFLMSRNLGLLFILAVILLVTGTLLSIFSQYTLFRWIEYTNEKTADIFGVKFIICFTVLIMIVNILSIIAIQVFSYHIIIYLYSHILDKILRSPIHMVFNSMSFSDLLKYFNKDLTIVHVILPSLVSQLVIVVTLAGFPLLAGGI